MLDLRSGKVRIRVKNFRIQVRGRHTREDSGLFSLTWWAHLRELLNQDWGWARDKASNVSVGFKVEVSRCTG